MRIHPLLLVDFYKTTHYKMYPKDTSKIYSNMTARKSRIKGIDKVVVFGVQAALMQIQRRFREDFFDAPREFAIDYYKTFMESTLGPGSVDVEHIEALWKIGYLPLEIKALPEGSLCPIGVPFLTITNTEPEAYWLVNYLETILSNMIWKPITVATIAFHYRKILNKYALETAGQEAVDNFVQWQGHDFSARGLDGVDAGTFQMGHLLSFTGTDTVWAIEAAKEYYFADYTKELVGASVPATEHSVMCMGTKSDEVGTFKRLLDLFPKGILSVVSDTWDLWKVCTEYVVELKEQILARDGKLVLRPDSGNPADIICGIKPSSIDSNGKNYPENSSSAQIKGVIELLWDAFGGTVNEQGYKVLDPHIGAIYGDSITPEVATDICERLKAKGFASTNVVLGIGSFTYQYVTRDTFGMAIKATYGEVFEIVDYSYPKGDGMSNDGNGTPVYEPVGREIFKDPITDDGTKKSAKGLLRVNRVESFVPDSMGDLHKIGDTFVLKDQCTKEEEKGGSLSTIFLDDKFTNLQTFSQIRAELLGNLK